MKTLFRKTALASALAATALASATPAMAHGYGEYHRGGGDTAGAAIAGGIIGIALGAIIASSSRHHDHDRYERAYDGYNYDRDGYRYDRDGRPWGYDRGGWNGGGYGHRWYGDR